MPASRSLPDAVAVALDDRDHVGQCRPGGTEVVEPGSTVDVQCHGHGAVRLRRACRGAGRTGQGAATTSGRVRAVPQCRSAHAPCHTPEAVGDVVGDVERREASAGRGAGVRPTSRRSGGTSAAATTVRRARRLTTAARPRDRPPDPRDGRGQLATGEQRAEAGEAGQDSDERVLEAVPGACGPVAPTGTGRSQPGRGQAGCDRSPGGDAPAARRRRGRGRRGGVGRAVRRPAVGDPLVAARPAGSGARRGGRPRSRLVPDAPARLVEPPHEVDVLTDPKRLVEAADGCGRRRPERATAAAGT